MNIKIKNMDIEDLENIKNILETDFDNFWNYNILKEELLSENSHYIVAIIGSEIVGFAGVKVVAGQADIMNVVTKKSFRRKGVGTLLLNNLISICNALKVSSIFLEVNENNAPAILLYEKLGFKKVSIRKNYYNNENGIVYVFQKNE